MIIIYHHSSFNAIIHFYYKYCLLLLENIPSIIRETHRGGLTYPSIFLYDWSEKILTIVKNNMKLESLNFSAGINCWAIIEKGTMTMIAYVLMVATYNHFNIKSYHHLFSICYY